MTGMDNKTAILMDEVTGLYREKQALLTGYLEMTQAQAAMQTAGEWGKVAAVLAAKDKVIAEINQADARRESRLTELMAVTGLETPEEVLAADLPGAAKVRAAREAINARLEEIRLVEAANAAAVRRTMDDLAREITGLRERKAAANSYGQPSPGRGSPFVDRRK